MSDIKDWSDKDIAGFDLSWCPQEHRGLMNELVGIEAVNIDNERDGLSYRFRPYPLSTLGGVMTQLTSMFPLGNFLEVGCGVGAKLVMVNKIFGLDVVGFDLNADYVKAAGELTQQYQTPVTLSVRDARTYEWYDSSDCVSLNRVFWDWDEEVALEEQVQEQLMGGALLLLGNGATTPSWPLIAEATALKVYQKPDRTTGM